MKLWPFETAGEAGYWGGGVVVPVDGGYLSLHYQETPAGPRLWTVGRARADARPWERATAKGFPWPYVYGWPADGGPKTVVLDSSVTDPY